jgi:hypothetical protein
MLFFGDPINFSSVTSVLTGFFAGRTSIPSLFRIMHRAPFTLLSSSTNTRSLCHPSRLLGGQDPAGEGGQGQSRYRYPHVQQGREALSQAILQLVSLTHI